MPNGNREPFRGLPSSYPPPSRCHSSDSEETKEHKRAWFGQRVNDKTNYELLVLQMRRNYELMGLERVLAAKVLSFLAPAQPGSASQNG